MTTDEGRPDAAAVAALAARLRRIARIEGRYVDLGPRHAAYFAEASDAVLLVTCERLDEIAARDDTALPFGLLLSDLHGWSHLCFLADGETGWREPRLWAHLDSLTDSGFFDVFDRVVFYGAGLAGHAAGAFSVAAPGSTVLLLSPRATLATDRAGWEIRHRALRRADYQSRYAFAPETIEAAGQALVIYDPWERDDAIHASFFVGSPAQILRWRGLGPDPEERLGAMGLLPHLVESAAAGKLDPAALSRRWRARRSNVGWLRTLLARTESRGPITRALRVCRAIVERHGSTRFQVKLRELEAAARRW